MSIWNEIVSTLRENNGLVKAKNYFNDEMGSPVIWRRLPSRLGKSVNAEIYHMENKEKVRH